MFNVDGETFRTQSEYELALKDKALIDEIKTQYDLTSESDIKSAYRVLQDIHFSSILGDKFDDYVYELYVNLKNGTKEERVNASKDSITVKSNELLNNKKTYDELKPEFKQKVLKEIKRRNRNRGILVSALILISILSLGYFGMYYKASAEKDIQSESFTVLKEDTQLAENINVKPVLKKDYDDEVVIPEILDEYKVLYNKNKSLIGWIKIADTIIDYPVMQASDNEFYLKYNFDHKKDANGCIFLDTNCDVILGNTNWILYGHHMKNGKMFSSLIKYANKDFYEQHKVIEFDTIYEKGKYEVMYAFRSHVYASDEIAFKYYQFIDALSAEEFDSYMEEMDKMSLIDTGVTAEFGDKLLTLSTCDYQEQNGRFVVVAKRIN